MFSHILIAFQGEIPDFDLVVSKISYYIGDKLVYDNKKMSLFSDQIKASIIVSIEDEGYCVSAFNSTNFGVKYLMYTAVYALQGLDGIVILDLDHERKNHLPEWVGLDWESAKKFMS